MKGNQRHKASSGGDVTTTRLRRSPSVERSILLSLVVVLRPRYAKASGEGRWSRHDEADKVHSPRPTMLSAGGVTRLDDFQGWLSCWCGWWLSGVYGAWVFEVTAQ